MTLNGIYKKVVANFTYLKPHERFTLFLSALARDDEETQIALGDSCPIERWAQRERDYTQRFDVAHRLAELVIFDMLVRLVFGLFAFDSKDHEIAQGAEDLLLSAAALWEGFGRFCQDIGTSREEFLLLSAYGLNKRGAKLLHPDRENNGAMCFEAAIQIVARLTPKWRARSALDRCG